MTMAEVLIVVAIIAVLGGLSFVAVWNYQRSLGQLERDNIAKEIFVAAQNHLTAAHGEGYLGLRPDSFGETAGDGTRYLVVNSAYFAANNKTIPDDTILGMMLPFGSIDDTVRIGGSYLIHYQPETGLMLDVFYCTRSGSPEQFNHELGSVENEYEIVMGLRGESNKNARRVYEQGGRSILGWYGGDGAALLPQITLMPPAITIKNEEKLYIEVTNPNNESTVTDPDGNSVSVNPKLKLLVTGVESGAQKAYELDLSSMGDRVKWNNEYYSVILDDITGAGMHFADIAADTEATTGKKFIPGEDLEIQAVAYSNSVLANVAYSAKGTTNSLFGSVNGAKDTAYIGNIRHLENLDKSISNLDANDGEGDDDQIKLAHAEQTDSFSWTTFRKKIREIESETEGSTAESAETVCVYPSSGNATKPGYYLPIRPDYELSYDGKRHSISEIATADKDAENADLNHAGLFGEIAESTVKEIKNLELIDFTIAGKLSAGALAGTIANTECAVSNVLARNSTNASDTNVAALTAGGLVGSMSGTMEYSAAALIVGGSSATTAGGLAGTASGTITGCYAGGHTTDGSYRAWVEASGHSYDVTASAAGTAGGLVGTYFGTKIENSYSTCSVSGGTAGGFVGITDTGSKVIQNCYAAGLVDGTLKYAFLASGSATLTGNYYYGVVNEIPKSDGGFELLAPCANTVALTAIRPIDLNAEIYNAFTGGIDDWKPARAYDPALVQYYSGKYNLRNVEQLGAELPDKGFVGTHYGDWPSPEVFVINE